MILPKKFTKLVVQTKPKAQAELGNFTAGLYLLGAILREGSREALNEIPEEWFTKAEEKATFVWMREYARHHKELPSRQVVQKERHVLVPRVTDPLSYYKDLARRRFLHGQFSPLLPSFRDSIMAMDPDAAADIARQIVAAHNQANQQGNGLVEIGDAMAEVVKDYGIAQWTPGLRGVTTGWPYVDQLTSGLMNADLWALVARPGRGKTYKLLWTAFHAWLSGRSVLFLSNELSSLQLGRRLVGIQTGLNPRTIRDGKLSTNAHVKMLGGIETLKAGAPFTIVVGSFRKSTNALRSLLDERSYDLIIVDAAYLMTPEKKRSGSASRREVVSDVIEELKMIGVDYNRPVYISVQFNRSAERGRKKDGGDSGDSTKKNPIAHLGLDKIGETDVVGQVASVAMGLELYDEPYANTRRWMGLLKGREGENGHWATRYQFEPKVDFSVISSGETEDSDLDLEWMM